MSGVLAEPLGSLHIVATLRRFVDLLSSSQGPNAGLKVVVTGGGVALVTSSSARIVRNLQLEDPVCLFVGQVVKAQLERCGDSGLYAGILMCRVVERVLSREDRLDVQRASRIIQRVALKLVRCLEEDGVRIPVEFSSVGQMLGVVRCVLSTKPACGLRKDDRESLAVSIVKAFLGTVENDMGHVIVTTGDGASVGFRVYRGILYQATDETLQSCYDGCNVSLLLFNFMLTENQKDDKISSKRSVDISAEDVGRENMLDDILSVFREAVKLNVKIIACQKVVHQSLKIYLRRKGILLLDRLGTAAASELAKLSGAVPISSVGSDVIDSLDSLLGRVDSVRLVHHDGKPYLCLERTDGNILTLFINAIGEEATSELQVVVKQCLSALHQLLAEPVVVPGAGCFEMCVCASLQQMLDDPGQYDCSRSQLMAALRIVQTAVLSAAGLRMSVSSPVAVDSVHRHAWLGRTVCRCKMVSASDVDSLGGSWRDVQCASEHGFLPEFEWFHPKPVSPKGVGEDVNVGLYCSKASALKTALESAVNLLSIGMVIQK